MHPAVFNAKVISNREIIPGVFRLTLKCRDMAKGAGPGQFIMIRVSENTDPLLRRPFSLCSTGEETVEILFKVVGRGTAIMATWVPEKVVNFIGPLGKGFWIPRTIKEAYLVAGGIGIAPLLFLTKVLNKRKDGIHINFFFGAKTKESISLIEDFKPLGADLFMAVEEGGCGFHGIVSDLLSSHFDNAHPKDPLCTAIFACGPMPMARAVGVIAEAHNIHCQISLESSMACGLGACLGCVLKTKHFKISSASGKEKHRESSYQFTRVCMEGPVFDSRAILRDNACIVDGKR